MTDEQTQAAPDAEATEPELTEAEVSEQMGVRLAKRERLIASGAEAYPVQLPITSDYRMAKAFAKRIDPSLVPVQGTAIGKALSGLHSQFPFILLDETGGMPVAVGKAARQIFTGNPADALIAQAGNPTDLNGLLYESCNRGG